MYGHTRTCACVVRLIKMCNRFTDPDMPLEQKVIIHTVSSSLILTSGKILKERDGISEAWLRTQMGSGKAFWPGVK